MPELTDLLITLYESEGVMSAGGEEGIRPIQSCPLSQLAAVVNGENFKVKKTRAKQLKRSSRMSEIIPDFAKVSHVSECCPLQAEEDDPLLAEDEKSRPRFAHLTHGSLRYLILALLESMVGHHGDVQLKSGRCLDQLVLAFALRHFGVSRSAEELRRLLRVALSSMVSHAQYQRSLKVDEIIRQLVDVADSVSSSGVEE